MESPIGNFRIMSGWNSKKMKIKNKKQSKIMERNISWNSLRGGLHPWKKQKLEDVKAAAVAHEQGRIEHASEQDGATGKSEYLGNFVYGGLDGIITTFAVVSGVVGAKLSPEIILILGLANLLGDGFSMATGAYLSAKSEQEVYSRERHGLSEQIVNAPEIEMESLYQGYRKQGYPEEDARQLTDLISRDPGRWVTTMMSEKLLLLPQKRKPVLEGAVTFIAFVIAGLLPLVIYLVDFIFHLDLATTTAFLFAVALSGLTLLSLGAAKVIVTKHNLLRSAIEMLLVGALAGLVAFLVGFLLKNLVGQ